MSNKKKCLIAVAVFLVLLVIVFFVLWIEYGTLKREYLPDIAIPLEEGELVVREWGFLVGGGAEFYYRKEGKKKLQLLGQGSTCDLYHPFEEGSYTVMQQGNEIFVRYCYRPKDPEIWHELVLYLDGRKKSFEQVVVSSE